MREAADPACPFRHSVRGAGAREDAVCGYLVELTGVRDLVLARVARAACVACCREQPPANGRFNPVVASLLYRLCDQIAERGGTAGCELRKAATLRAEAESHLAPSRLEPTPLVGCDVVVCCRDATPDAERAIASVLAQRGANAIVHLVDDGGRARALVERFRGLWNVVTHANPRPIGPFATLHGLVPHLRGEFVALQDPDTVSRPDRLARSVRLLVELGADLLAAPLAIPGGVLTPEPLDGTFRRQVAPQTLVFRRASLVDLGGFADRPGDADIDLVCRAVHERRTIVIDRETTVIAASAPDDRPPGPEPHYVERQGVLRHHAIGFPHEAVECDVVLPFHGQLEFVRAALASILDQDGAEAVVHLIDDDTPGGATAFLKEWATHPRVRTYRNLGNLGQFHSFNNVVPYLETRLVAVQDGDDLSRPQRLHRSGNGLRLADADIFGARTWMFHQRPDGSTQPLGPGRCVYPRPDGGDFLQNPTAMIRVSAFEALRGFGDYGDLERNKCGLDTEFYVRAFHAGFRFALSIEPLVDYRVHPDSAVNNGVTGFGSAARLWSLTENNRRFATFQQGRFDPRVFGALQVARGRTVRIP